MIDWFDKIFNIVTECEEYLDEGVRKKVIRKGKLKKKLFCQPGQKAVGGRCVTMKSKEKARRKIKAKKSALKRKAKMNKITRKRNKSLRKRRKMGLK